MSATSTRGAVGAVLRYGVREGALRWRAQPASPLARWVLTFALASAAAILLMGFAAAERARRAELRRLGLDTLVIQAAARGPLEENQALPAGHWAGALAGRGSVLLLQQVPDLVESPAGDPLPGFVCSLPTLTRLGMRGGAGGSGGGGGAGALLYTRALPEGRVLPLSVDHLPVEAVVAAPVGPMQALGLDPFVVMAEGSLPESRGTGRLDVVLFTPRPGAGAEGAGAGGGVAGVAGALRRLASLEGEPAPVIRDPTPYQVALDLFTRSQNRWRTGMAGLLGATVLLVFASIGMLEERQTRYTQALLRSLGVPGLALWGASVLENLILANSALVAALAASRAAAGVVLALAGALSPDSYVLPAVAVVWLACAINFGVLLSLLPLALALRRPVGSILP